MTYVAVFRASAQNDDGAALWISSVRMQSLISFPIFPRKIGARKAKGGALRSEEVAHGVRVKLLAVVSL